MLAGATNSSAFQAGLTLAPLLAGLPLSLGHGLPSVGWIGVALGVAALGGSPGQTVERPGTRNKS